MFVIEFKTKPKPNQVKAIDNAIRTCQFVRNKCISYWENNQKVNQYDLYKYTTQLRKEYPFVKNLNSMACQASTERAWFSIERFYDNCLKKKPGKKGYPKYKKNTRSVEYKNGGWKLLSPKRIKFTDRNKIGELKLIGTWDLSFFKVDSILRVRLVKRADGYYCQFVIKANVTEKVDKTGKEIGLDLGLNHFYTDSNGDVITNPRFYRKAEKDLKKKQRELSKKKKGSNNRKKARNRLARKHLKVSRQRKDFAVKLARCVVQSNDLIAYEDLKVKNMVKNHCLAKSINDAGWYLFRTWVEYFAKKMDKLAIPVNPRYTSQECSNCGTIVKKGLSTRTHVCKCGFVLDRDYNAAINILNKAKGTSGHDETYQNATGDQTSIVVGSNTCNSKSNP